MNESHPGNLSVRALCMQIARALRARSTGRTLQSVPGDAVAEETLFNVLSTALTYVLVGGAISYVLLLACIGQFLALYCGLRTQLPTRADAQAGDAFLQLLRDTEGEVFVPWHGYLPVLAGKNTYAHSCAIGDVFSDEDTRITGPLQDKIAEAIRGRRFEVVVLDTQWLFTFMGDIERHYEDQGLVFNNVVCSGLSPARGPDRSTCTCSESKESVHKS
ncbi:MAG: hypothetical protein A2Y76_05000 [Planctomycetes bacterium RBG_13_60_9]|nr:MAG: hypothetical protein A2Y76_05000 [Planctomycetes bacterium RBG_13_60_9]